MTNISKLKRDIETVRHALSRDKQGFDQDGYDSEGFDRYGRSREMMKESAKYSRVAFDSLTREQQDLVLKAQEIHMKYERKSIMWEKQPKQVRRQYPFYEEWAYHSDITKHAFLESQWITPEEKKITYAAFHIMLEARKKFDPYYTRGFH